MKNKRGAKSQPKGQQTTTETWFTETTRSVLRHHVRLDEVWTRTSFSYKYEAPNKQKQNKQQKNVTIKKKEVGQKWIMQLV